MPGIESGEQPRPADLEVGSRFLTRSGRVARSLARTLVALQPGDRMPTLSELAHDHEVGTGTVQKALEILTEGGYVKLESRGRLGTFVVGSDLAGLWRLAAGSKAVGLMPLPYSRRYEGLATGLRLAWKAESVHLLLSFARGGVERIEALASTWNEFAIVSAFAAERAVEAGHDVRVALGFGPGSYVLGHVVLFAPGRGPRIVDGYRVGIDSASFDQVALTRHECEGIDVEFVEIGYMQLMEALAVDQIQAAVWAADEVQHQIASIERQPLSNVEAKELATQMTEAVAVVANENEATCHLLRSALVPSEVRAIQEEVMEGKRIPSY